MDLTMRLTPDYWEFDTVEEYAWWVLAYPTRPITKGRIFIIRINELDQVWVHYGDGETALIDLPKQIISN